MTNFTSANPSFDAMLAAWGKYGGMCREMNGHFVAGTAATNSGGVTIQRWPAPMTIPTVGAGVAGYTLNPSSLIFTGAPTTGYAALEYRLGTLTLNGNSASNLGSMPTKTMLGTSIQTGSKYLVCHVRTTGTATTPTITITYTNQDGTGSQSTSIVLPTTPLANSGFLIPLANGDSGVQAITGLSSSVTTGALVLDFYGILELAVSNFSAVATADGTVETLLTPTLPKYLCATGDTVNCYFLGSAAAHDFIASLIFAPEPS